MVFVFLVFYKFFLGYLFDVFFSRCSMGSLWFSRVFL